MWTLLIHCKLSLSMLRQTHSECILAEYQGQAQYSSPQDCPRLARNQEDCANRKSPANTATLVPKRVLTVIFPTGTSINMSRPSLFSKVIHGDSLR